MVPVRVLCVDDNPDVADTTAELIQLFGCDATACYSGAAALTSAQEFRPDVCLVDLNMPGMNGDELAIRLRDMFPKNRPALVAVTAMSGEAARSRTRNAGFDMHLVKPVDPDRLMAAIYILGGPSGPVNPSRAV